MRQVSSEGPQPSVNLDSKVGIFRSFCRLTWTALLSLALVSIAGCAPPDNDGPRGVHEGDYSDVFNPGFNSPGTGSSGKKPDSGQDASDEACSVICQRFDGCVPSDSAILEHCATRCPVALDRGLIAETTASCLVAAQSCDDTLGCLEDDGVCDAACDALVSCGVYADRESCEDWCVPTALAGGLTDEQLRCIASAHDEGRCADVNVMCIHGRRNRLDASCGIYPESQCQSAPGCDCEIAWRPCEPALTCTGCARACQKFVGCNYQGQQEPSFLADCMATCEADWSPEAIACFDALPASNVDGHECDMNAIVACQTR